MVKNKITGEAYIGQSKYGLAYRVKRHHQDAFSRLKETKIAKALRKYGEANFEFSVLYEVDCADKITLKQLEYSLNQLEKFYIKEYDTFKHGYNDSEGGSANKFKYEDYKAMNEAYKKRRQARNYAKKKENT